MYTPNIRTNRYQSRQYKSHMDYTKLSTLLFSRQFHHTNATGSDDTVYSPPIELYCPILELYVHSIQELISRLSTWSYIKVTTKTHNTEDICTASRCRICFSSHYNVSFCNSKLNNWTVFLESICYANERKCAKP